MTRRRRAASGHAAFVSTQPADHAAGRPFCAAKNGIRYLTKQVLGLIFVKIGFPKSMIYAGDLRHAAATQLSPFNAGSLGGMAGCKPQAWFIIFMQGAKQSLGKKSCIEKAGWRPQPVSTRLR